ncbi:AN1-type zinc finger protein 4 isoform X3 [Nannospalax galili]|uniref:AN1-type zinc finger protein 4 isoform X3 n=1 Tax=Nannospalax galili TaxID=1026970 RepID=UPI00111BF6B6|nr:AN1-type zinc finger protein 4 isoform X3 [Nannospalax galili]
MELFIETLTGTCFELRVSPFETVISVKGKIQRLEVPLEDPLRELAEYMDSSRDEVWEKTCNKQVTFLVSREGGQLNFFRVIDRGDGTSPPLSESLSGGSVYNLYTDEDEEAEPSPSGQQIIENSITMNKMKVLKAKMESMNLSKKPKKVIKVHPHPPVAPRPSSTSTAAARHRLLRVLPHIGQSCLPSPGNAYLPETCRNAGASSAAQAPADRPVSSLRNQLLKEVGNREISTLPHRTDSTRLLPQLTLVESENDKALADSALHLGSSLPWQTKHFSGNLPSSNEDDSVLFPPSEECVPEEALLPEVGPFVWFAEENGDEQSSGLEGVGEAGPECRLTYGEVGLRVAEQRLNQMAGARSSEPGHRAGLGHREAGSHRSRLLSGLLCAAPVALHNSLRKPQSQSKCFESGNLPPCTSQNALRELDTRPIADASFSRTARLRAVKVGSPGKRSDTVSKVEARDTTEIANKASIGPIGRVNNSGLLASLARCASRDGLQSIRGAGRFRPSGIGLCANLQHFQDESIRSSPQSEPTEFFLSARGIGMNGNNATTGKKVGESTHRLPPVKALLQTKRKIAKHCFLCGKKTGLATSFKCRCGNNFCASHRYAETHSCTYDYKSTGRKYLQEANPVVNAPKLPKI